ncbi:replication initiation factor domain-containing protein [Acinetobacter sp. MD2]|uniref:replication initiation factor domain-containing protein n=1 Tax=Acinetobacter sp. MD2 TaxID=2600066 RepID=UPI002D1F6A2D|nr:replication initiation factor domain-containing protein [Acinetobacter sp. MD2]MEB3767726.1 replication initiation factor domain-containing protein [Acinetobacter sp. MD2]
MATNSLHTNGTFSTLPLWGKVFEWAGVNPLSNTGEKLESANRALTRIRKSYIEQMIHTSDSEEKAVIVGKFEKEIEEIKLALKEEYRDYPLLDTQMVLTDDGEKPVLFRRPAHCEVAVTDWLNFTLNKSTFSSMKREKLKGYEHLNLPDCYVSDSDYAYAMGTVIKDIFGFGIECKMNGGINHYKEAYKLENGCGFICVGGDSQRDTMLISITGVGCTLGYYGWEADLHAWLCLFADRPKITRIDYAFDDHDGQIANVQWAKEQFELKGFQSGGRPPQFNIIGDYWQPDGSGTTAYIGNRKSSKFCRIYEKGKQLGCKESPWVRVEVEYKGKDFHIPLDALLHPSQHFLAAYPCFHTFDNQMQPLKFETIKKTAEITWEKAISVTRHQFGKYLSAFRSFYEDDALLLDILTHDKYDYPDRLKPLYLDYSKSMPPMPLPA